MSMTPAKKFLKSLAWNFGIFGVLYVLDFTAKNLGMFNLDPTALAVISILIARITKLINTYLTEKAAAEEY